MRSSGAGTLINAGSGELRKIAILALPVVLLAVLIFTDGGFDLPARQGAWLAIWWGLALALAFNLIPRVSAPNGWTLVLAGMLTLALLQLLSMVRGPSPDLALDDAATTIGYLGVLTLARSCLGPRSWRQAAMGLFLAASIVTVYALIGRLTPSLSTLTDAQLLAGSERLLAPLGYWNAMGAWAGATVAMALAWSADARGANSRGLALAVFPIAVGVLYLTYSRGGVVATCVSVSVVLALTRNRKRATLHALVGGAAASFVVISIRSQPDIANGVSGNGGLTVAIFSVLAAGACWVFATGRISGNHRTRVAYPPSSVGPALVLAGLVVIGVVSVVLLAGSHGFGKGGDTGAVPPDDPSARLVSVEGSRSEIWPEALRGFAYSPLLGEGAGSFAYRWAASDPDAELVKDAHSLPFETAAELGIAGLLAGSLILAGLTFMGLGGLDAARRTGPAVGLFGATVVFFTSCAVDWTWDSAPLALLGLGSVVVLGMAGTEPLNKSRSRSAGAKQTLSARLRWALVVGAVGLGAVQVPGAVSTELIDSSEAQLVIGKEDGALAAAEDAVSAAPWSARAEAARSEALLEIGDLGGAREAASEAILAEPKEPGHRLLLARIEAADASFPAAAESLRRAVALSPSDPRLAGTSTQELVETLARAGFSLEEILTGSPAGP